MAHAGIDPLVALTERDWVARAALSVVAEQEQELAAEDREDLAIRFRNEIVDAWNGGGED